MFNLLHKPSLILTALSLVFLLLLGHGVWGEEVKGRKDKIQTISVNQPASDIKLKAGDDPEVVYIDCGRSGMDIESKEITPAEREAVNAAINAAKKKGLKNRGTAVPVILDAAKGKTVTYKFPCKGK